MARLTPSQIKNAERGDAVFKTFALLTFMLGVFIVVKDKNP